MKETMQIRKSYDENLVNDIKRAMCKRYLLNDKFRAFRDGLWIDGNIA